MYEVSEERFEELVGEALDKIPDRFVEQMRNVVILVEDKNPENPHLLGLYEGVMLTERTASHTGYLPDAISIYRKPLQSICNSEEELAHEVMVTVFHEVGHYFGFEEDRLHELGWG